MLKLHPAVQHERRKMIASLESSGWWYKNSPRPCDKRILFDAGNDADIFAHNVAAKGIDLAKLDFAVVSHHHSDHTSGLNHLLKVNPL